VNDASNGTRTAIRNWADPTGAGYQSTAHWGVGRLVEAEGLRNTVPPVITGTPVKGRVLTADPGEWSVEDATYDYQWLRDGKPIRQPQQESSGSGPTYKVKPWDVGHELSVEVTARAGGHDPVTATSEPVTVRKEKPKS
jgi:endo-1,4-beta-xylanase